MFNAYTDLVHITAALMLFTSLTLPTFLSRSVTDCITITTCTKMTVFRKKGRSTLAGVLASTAVLL